MLAGHVRAFSISVRNRPGFHRRSPNRSPAPALRRTSRVASLRSRIAGRGCWERRRTDTARCCWRTMCSKNRPRASRRVSVGHRWCRRRGEGGRDPITDVDPRQAASGSSIVRRRSRSCGGCATSTCGGAGCDGIDSVLRCAVSRRCSDRRRWRGWRCWGRSTS